MKIKKKQLLERLTHSISRLHTDELLWHDQIQLQITIKIKEKTKRSYIFVQFLYFIFPSLWQKY